VDITDSYTITKAKIQCILKMTLKKPPTTTPIATRTLSPTFKLDSKCVGIAGKLVFAGSSSPATDAHNLDYIKRSILEKQKEKIQQTQNQIKCIRNPSDRRYLENELQTLKQRWKQLHYSMDEQSRSSTLPDDDFIDDDAKDDDVLVDDEPTSPDRVIKRTDSQVSFANPISQTAKRRASSAVPFIRKEHRVRYSRPHAEGSVEQPKFHNFFQPLAIRFASDRLTKVDKSTLPKTQLPAVHYQTNNYLNTLVVDKRNRNQQCTVYTTNDDDVYSLELIETQKFLNQQYNSTAKPIGAILPHRMKFHQVASRASTPVSTAISSGTVTPDQQHQFPDSLLSCSKVKSFDYDESKSLTISQRAARHHYTSNGSIQSSKPNIFNSDLSKQERRTNILMCLYKDRSKQLKMKQQQYTASKPQQITL
jgi:hypothetical protein